MSCCTTRKAEVSCLMRSLCFMSLCLVWVMFSLIILMTVWCAMSTRTHALRKQVQEAFFVSVFPLFISHFLFLFCQKVPVEGASKGNYESVAVSCFRNFFSHFSWCSFRQVVQGRARKKLVYLAKVVSFISIVTTLMGGMTGVILYFVFNSSQLLLCGQLSPSLLFALLLLPFRPPLHVSSY